MPFERLGVGDDGGSRRRQFVLAGNWISLVRQQFTVGADDLVFVGFADRQTWNEQLPDAAHRGEAASDGGGHPRR